MTDLRYLKWPPIAAPRRGVPYWVVMHGYVRTIAEWHIWTGREIKRVRTGWAHRKLRKLAKRGRAA